MGQFHITSWKIMLLVTAWMVSALSGAKAADQASVDAQQSGTTNTVSNLNQALIEALQSNPEILLQKAEREASDHRITQSVGAYLPSLQLRSSIGRESTKQNFKANTALNSSAVTGRMISKTQESSVVVNQKVFDGLTTVNDIKKSRRELDQTTKNVEEAQILTAYSVIEKYITVRRFERLLKLSKENVKAHKNVLAIMKVLVEAGKATIGDQQNVESRLFDAEAAVGDIEGQLDTAYGNFKEVVGAEANQLAIPRFNETLIPATVKEAIAKARMGNRSVLVAQAAREVASCELDKTVGAFMPSIDMQVQARRARNSGGRIGLQTDVTGQVIGSFNVLNGGRDVGRHREMRARLTSATFRAEKEMRRAEKETRVSYGEFLSARAQSVALRGAVKSKESVRDIYMKQFEGGTKSFLDILDSIHEYFLAKGSLITADATGDLAAARILASMGILLEDFKGVNLDPTNSDYVDQAKKFENDTSDDALMHAAADENSGQGNEGLSGLKEVAAYTDDEENEGKGQKKSDQQSPSSKKSEKSSGTQSSADQPKTDKTTVVATPVDDKLSSAAHTQDMSSVGQALQGIKEQAVAQRETDDRPQGNTQPVAAQALGSQSGDSSAGSQGAGQGFVY